MPNVNGSFSQVNPLGSGSSFNQQIPINPNGAFSQNTPFSAQAGQPQRLSGTIGGGSGVCSFTFEQEVASLVWTVPHGLNKNPCVTVFDSLGNSVIGDVEYIDTNSLKITFSLAISGFAYLN